MKIYLVYFTNDKYGEPDDLLGIFASMELAKKAIERSWYSREAKKEVYVDSFDVNIWF